MDEDSTKIYNQDMGTESKSKSELNCFPNLKIKTEQDCEVSDNETTSEEIIIKTECVEDESNETEDQNTFVNIKKPVIDEENQIPEQKHSSLDKSVKCVEPLGAVKHINSYNKEDIPKIFLKEKITISDLKYKQKESDGTYSCDLCERKFMKIYSLLNHMRSHTGHKPYACDICHKSFIQKASLNNHKRLHTGEKPFQCDMCERKFTNLGSLINHKRTHTGEKPYTCGICSRSFAQSTTLINHMRIHREKQYDCQFCSKKFTNKSSQYYHTKTHSGEKRYNCKVCDKKFESLSSLMSHKRIHIQNSGYEMILGGPPENQITVDENIVKVSGKSAGSKKPHSTKRRPSECPICNKVFSQSHVLVNHIRIHTGEKPFECDTCKKKFRNHSTLVNHKRTHTGEKPYKCDVCNKKFTNLCNLVNHNYAHERQGV